MGMRIQSNVAALNAQKNLGKTGSDLEKSIGKLSSGLRLQKASDDAAGMGIANKIRADVKALLQASRNASQATSLVQVAEGAVNTISSILDRMKELATQAASDSVTDSDRTKINSEFVALKDEVDRIADNTKYQGQTLVHGTYGVSVSSIAASGVSGSGVSSTSAVTLSNAQASSTYTISSTSSSAVAGTITLTASMSGGGTAAQTLSYTALGAQSFNFDKLGVKVTVDSGYASSDALDGAIVTSAANGGTFSVGTANNSDDKISLTLGDLTTSGLSINGNTLTSLSNAQAAVTAIDSAIGTLNTTIGTIGAAANRFDYAMRNLASLIENMGASESVIRDADMAYEMTEFTKSQVQQQAGTSMLAQANASPQAALQLLRGG